MTVTNQGPSWNWIAFLLGVVSGQLHKHLLNIYNEPDVVDTGDTKASEASFGS